MVHFWLAECVEKYLKVNVIHYTITVKKIILIIRYFLRPGSEHALACDSGVLNCTVEVWCIVKKI